MWVYGLDWIGLAQDRDRWCTLVSAVMNLRVPLNAGNFLTSCKTVSCSGRTLHHGVSKYFTGSSQQYKCYHKLLLKTEKSANTVAFSKHCCSLDFLEISSSCAEFSTPHQVLSGL